MSRRNIFVIALLVFATLAFFVATNADAHRPSLDYAKSRVRATNVGGWCGLGATYYCAKIGTVGCPDLYGAHSRKCYGYYTNGPCCVWPWGPGNGKGWVFVRHDGYVGRLSNDCCW